MSQSPNQPPATAAGARVGKRDYTDTERLDALVRWGLAFATPGGFAEDIVEVERYDECQNEDCDGRGCCADEQEWTVIGPREDRGVWLHGVGPTLREAIDDALRAEENTTATLDARIAAQRAKRGAK